MKGIQRLFLCLLIGVVAINGLAAKRYWIGNGTNMSWNNTANWSTSSGGSGGASVPGTNDTAYFNGSGLGKCLIDVTVSIRRFEINTGYNQDTIFQNKKAITVTNRFWIQDGVFWGDSNNISITNYLVIDGGVFRSTQSTLTTFSGITKNAGTFLHNNGKIKGSNSAAVFTGSITLYDLEFYNVNNYTYTISSGTILTLENDLTLSGSGYISVSGGAIHIKGDCYMSNTNGTLGGTSLIEFNGTAGQHLYGRPPGAGGGVLPNVKINKSSDTLFLHDRIPVVGSWTYTSGIVSPGTSNIQCYGTGPAFPITGNHTLYSLQISGGVFQFTSSTITLNGSLVLGSGSVYMQYGAINLKGNLYVRATQGASCCSNTHTLTINGTGDQTISGDTTGSWTNRLPSIVINKSSGTLYLVGTIYPENWTYTSGNLNVGSSTLYFTLTQTITGTHSLNNVSFGTLSTNTNTTTISSGTAITANGNLTLNGSGQLTINTGDLHVKGNITVTNTSTSSSGGGTANLYIDGTGNQTFNGGSALGKGSPPDVFIDKSSGTLTLAGVITARGDWTYTSGTVNADTTTVGFYGTKNLDGQESGSFETMNFNKIEINGSRTLTGKLSVLNNLKINASSTLTTGGNDIAVGGNWTNSGTFSTSGGFVSFNGTGTQTVSKPGSTETFKKLKLDKSNTSGVTFDSPVIVTDTLDLREGIITTTSSNYLKINDNGFARNGSDSGYVTGPMRKIGNDVFTFPLGGLCVMDGTANLLYHPLEISLPGSATDEFEAEYFPSQQSNGFVYDDSITNISSKEYWKLSRLIGTSNLKVTLNWNRNADFLDYAEDFTVANWDGAKWAFPGQGILVNNGTTGKVQSANVITSWPSNLTLALKQAPSFVHVERLLDGEFYPIPGNLLRFKYREEYRPTMASVNYSIYDMNRQVLISSATQPKPVVHGDNRIMINISSLTTGAYYVLEVKNEKGELWKMRFKKV